MFNCASENQSNQPCQLLETHSLGPRLRVFHIACALKLESPSNDLSMSYFYLQELFTLLQSLKQSDNCHGKKSLYLVSGLKEIQYIFICLNKKWSLSVLYYQDFQILSDFLTSLESSMWFTTSSHLDSFWRNFQDVFICRGSIGILHLTCIGEIWRHMSHPLSNCLTTVLSVFCQDSSTFPCAF